MIPKYTINNFRDAVTRNVGKSIFLQLKRGRKMIKIYDCNIEKAYNSIFVVKINGESLIKQDRISISYADLLTGCASITLTEDVKPA